MIYPLVLANLAQIYVGKRLALAFAQAKSYYQLPAPESSLSQGTSDIVGITLCGCPGQGEGGQEAGGPRPVGEACGRWLVVVDALSIFLVVSAR